MTRRESEAAGLPAYDVVMATRNRPEAVRLSLPLILGQSHPPRRVVLVDSSDDPAPIEAIAGAAARAGAPVDLHRSAPGLTRQRNLGLAALDAAGDSAEIVLFPDDDSLLYPDAAAKMMAVYARGPEVAAVGAAEAAAPPGGVDLAGSYAAPARGRLAAAALRARKRIVRGAAAANPFLAVGARLNAVHPRPGWLAEERAVPVAYLTGFRMSFRRAALAGAPGLAPGFDEALERYAWFEDVDASFAAMRHGLVLGAEGALIHHHRFPGRRGDGRAIGLWAMLNRAYVVMKHVRAAPEVFPNPGREAMRLRLYLAGRAAAYGAMARDRWGIARARGAAAGLARAGRLLAPTAAPGLAGTEELARRYRALAGR